MNEVDYGPRRAGRATKNRENDQPGEEKYEYIGGPHTWIHEPLSVPIQIRRWRRLDIQIHHHRICYFLF